MLTDCHAHLSGYFSRERLSLIVQHAKDFGVRQIIALGMDVETSKEAVRLADSYEGVYAGVGIHPMKAHEISQDDYEELREVARSSRKIVCIGEIGLDYGQEYGPGIPPRPAPPALPDLQKEVFRRQITLAKELKLPINVHVRRSSLKDVLSILLQEETGDVGGILHQFMANEKIAQEIFDMGMHIGLSQFICDPRADRLRAVVKNLPLEKVVLETDAPAPYPPESDIPGEPMHTRLVAEKLAELKGLSLSDIAAITSANVKRVFGVG